MRDGIRQYTSGKTCPTTSYTLRKNMEHSCEGIKQSCPVHRRYIAETPRTSLTLKVNIASNYVAVTSTANEDQALTEVSHCLFQVLTFLLAVGMTP